MTYTPIDPTYLLTCIKIHYPSPTKPYEHALWCRDLAYALGELSLHLTEQYHNSLDTIRD